LNILSIYGVGDGVSVYVAVGDGVSDAVGTGVSVKVDVGNGVSVIVGVGVSVKVDVTDGVALGVSTTIRTQKFPCVSPPVPKTRLSDERSLKNPIYVPALEGAVKFTEISTCEPGGTTPVVN